MTLNTRTVKFVSVVIGDHWGSLALLSFYAHPLWCTDWEVVLSNHTSDITQLSISGINHPLGKLTISGTVEIIHSTALNVVHQWLHKGYFQFLYIPNVWCNVLYMCTHLLMTFCDQTPSFLYLIRSGG